MSVIQWIVMCSCT